MATATKRSKPAKKTTGESPIGTTVVVVARCSADDVPVRCFDGPTSRHDALKWVKRLARSQDACDETVKTLCDRIGWELASYGVMFFSLVVHQNGIPAEKLEDVFIPLGAEVVK
jgi:hypothetical protein